MTKRILGLAILLLSCIAPKLHAQTCVTQSQVTLTGNLRSGNGLPSSNYTLSFRPSQQGYVAGCGVNLPTTFACATSTDGSVVGLPNPLTTTQNTTAGTGSLTPGIYYSVYAWYDAAGHITLASPESTTQLSSTGSVVVNPPASGLPSGAVGMQVYLSTTPGSETLQGATTGNGSYVQSTALTTGSSPLTANNTLCQLTANDAIWPVGTGYITSLTDRNGNPVPSYPMQWQLNGPGTTINLSNGLPYYHGVVQYPVPILVQPQNHGQQFINGPLNLGGYALTNVGPLTSLVTNGTVHANQMSGIDIGAKVNAALPFCGYQCTIYIDAGGYSFTTPISLPLNVFGRYKLQGDPGAVLTYTGTGDAIATPIGVNGPGDSQLLIEGFQLFGTSAATSGIHTYPTNRITIRNMLIQGFSNGDGIRVEGTNSSNIYDNLITNNLNGIHLIPTICNGTYPYTCSSTGTGPNVYTPNNIHIFANQLVVNTHWGVWDDRANNSGGLTGSLNNVLRDNDMENNGIGSAIYGGFYAMHSTGWLIEGNYWEGSPRRIVLGESGAGSALATNGPLVIGNYFTSQPPATPATTAYNIELQNTSNAQIIGNSDLVTNNVGGNNCEINVTSGGEVGTYIGKNSFYEFSPSGNPLCIGGTAVLALTGAASYIATNTNYLMTVVNANYAITSSGTSETVSLSANVTASSVCQATPATSSSVNVTPVSVIPTGSNTGTFYHPSGQVGTRWNLSCAPGPFN